MLLVSPFFDASVCVSHPNIAHPAITNEFSLTPNHRWKQGYERIKPTEKFSESVYERAYWYHGYLKLSGVSLEDFL